MRTIQRCTRLFQQSVAGKSENLFVRASKKFTIIFIVVFSLSSAVSAQTGRALDFDGVDNYVTLPGTLLPAGTSYTKEAWVNIRSTAAFGNNFISGVNSAFWAPGGILSAGYNFANFHAQDPTPLVIGTWYHVAVTYDVTNDELRLYKNGIQVDLEIGPGTFIGETEQYLGTYNNGGGPGGFLMDGQMDEVRIWNVVRTQAQLAASMSCELTGDEPGLMAYYRFNQGTAGANNAGQTTLNDATDRCLNNGTLSGFTLNGATSNWVAPGGTVIGTCAGSFANITVTGNAVCIADGDVSPDPSDHTDYQSGFTRTFTIQNTGNATLNITSVTITGANANQFSVTTSPAATVAGPGSTTFTITFNPTSNGVKVATINVNTDDGDEAVYNFDITASFFTLPVNLISFTVKKVSAHAELNWVTASETDNLGFDVQRSTDGRNWTTIGFVAGAGTTTTEKSYTYTDATPKKGTNYYRVRQVDFDNHGTFSEVRAVTFASDATLVYPVPTNDKVIIELSDSRLVGSQATISDQQGKLIKQVTITKMQQEISLSNLPAGIYLLKMDDGITHKLIKQ